MPCKARFRRNVWVLWMHSQAWIMSDLHPGNIMREPDGQPCIIDALLAPIAPGLIETDRLLREAVEDARAWREDRPRKGGDPFAFVSDDEL